MQEDKMQNSFSSLNFQVWSTFLSLLKNATGNTQSVSGVKKKKKKKKKKKRNKTKNQGKRERQAHACMHAAANC